jgi:hypothetical protein
MTKDHSETFDPPSEWAKWHSEGEIIKRRMDDAPIVRNFDDKPAERWGGTKILGEVGSR